MRDFRYPLYRLKYRYGKYLPLRKPVDIALELSSMCDMRCKYCYHADPKRPFGLKMMPTLTAQEIIAKAADAGVHSIKFNWRGEPTLNMHFGLLSRYAYSFADGMTFVDRICNSNFNFKRNAHHIFDGLAHMTKVKVSLDSFRKDVFDSQRPGGDHSRIIENVNRFYNWPGRHNTIIIQAIRTKLNKDEDIHGQVYKRWPEARVSVRDMVEGRTQENVKDITTRTRDFSDRRACDQAFVRLIFDHNGRAYPCCPDIKGKYCLGDIHEKSIPEIFNSNKAKLLRLALKSKHAFRFHPCKDCSSYESFAGYKPGWDS